MQKSKHETSGNSPQRKQVLADHEKRNKGKLLVPPLIAEVGPFSYVPWIDSIIPETVWIGLLQEVFGEHEGTALATHLAKTTSEVAGKNHDGFFVGASEYAGLAEKEKAAVRESLSASGKLILIQASLFPLLHFYPVCPFSFLAREGCQQDNPALALETLKHVLNGLFDKQTRRAVMVQATVVYIAFLSGRLKVAEGLSLAHFPEIEKYPTTEMSCRVAAAARCALFTFFGEGEAYSKTKWPVTFWKK
jgi:hypothetical protein